MPNFAQGLTRGGANFNKGYGDQIALTKENQLQQMQAQSQQAQMEAQQMKIAEQKRLNEEREAMQASAQAYAATRLGGDADFGQPGGAPGGQQAPMDALTRHQLETNPAAYMQSQIAAQAAGVARKADFDAKVAFEPHKRFATPQQTNINMDRQLPKGWAMNPDGSASPIKGGPVDPVVMKQQATADTVAKQAVDMPGIRKGIITKRDRLPILSRNIGDIKSLSEGFMTSGIIGQAMGPFANTDQYALEAKLKNIQSAVGLQELVDIKAAGGTFGALSDTEMTLLISSVGALDGNLRPEDLGKVLDDIERLYTKGLKQAETDFTDKYPDATTPWGVNKVKGDADFNKLQSGDKYVGPDGVERIKG